MPGTFTLSSFATRLASAAAAQSPAEAKGLEKAAQIVEDAAKAAIGNYSFGWTPLAPDTIAHKGNGDTPLLETGELRDSIEHVVLGRTAEVGSNDQVAVFQELGTANIPPRSFLAQAAMRNGKAAAEAVGAEIFATLKA